MIALLEPSGPSTLLAPCGFFQPVPLGAGFFDADPAQALGLSWISGGG